MRPDAAVIVGAHNDAYVSPQSIRELAAHWPGSQVHVPARPHTSCRHLRDTAPLQGVYRV